MADQIKSEDIFEKDLFLDANKDAKKLLDTLDEIEKVFIQLAKNSIKIFEGFDPKKSEDVKTFNKAIKESTTAIEGLSEIEKEREKLLKKLDKLNSSAIQDNEQLKVQAQEQAKVNKRLAKESLGLIGTYEKQSKRLNELRKRFKNLRLEEGKDTKQTKKLQREIKKLDGELKDVDASVGQFNRNVGDYSKSVKDAASSTLKWVGGLGAAKLSLDGLNSVVNASAEGTEILRTVTAQAAAGVSVYFNRLFGLGKALKNLVTGEGSLDDVTGSFDGFVDEVIQSAEAAKQAETAQIDLERSQRGLFQSIALLNGEIEAQNLIAGDSTISFNRQEAAARRATELQIERALTIEGIAKEELRIIDERIAALGKGANQEELLQEQSERRIELTEAQNELDLARLDNEKLIREIQRDRFEQELDFAIDAFDAVKTVNERRITDDRLTFEQRRDILIETNRLAESSFANQIKLAEGIAGKQLELNELVKIDDEEVIRARLRANDLNEIVQQRILEIIRERKIAVQDLAEAERDLNDALAEQIAFQEEIINSIDQEVRAGEIAAAQRADNRRDEFALRRTQLIDQAEFEQSRAELTADEILLIQERLNNDLAALDADRVQSAKDADKERIDSIKDTVNEIASITQDEIAKNNDRRNEALDADIDRREEAVDRQFELFKEGNENTFIEEKARLEQARLLRQQEQEEQRKKDEAIALTLAFFNAFAANSKDDPSTALAKSLRQTLLAKAVGATLASFKEGTEDTGKASNAMDSDGGRLAILHDNERVLTKDQNRMVGGMSNEKLAQLANEYNSGNTWGFQNAVASHSDKKNDIAPMVKKIEESNRKVVEAIENNKVTTKFDFDSLNQMIERIYKKGSRKIITHVSSKPRI